VPVAYELQRKSQGGKKKLFSCTVMTHLRMFRGVPRYVQALGRGGRRFLKKGLILTEFLRILTQDSAREKKARRGKRERGKGNLLKNTTQGRWKG